MEHFFFRPAIPSNREEDEETSTPILSPLYMGSGAGALFVLTLLVVGPIVLCLLLKWHRRPKRMVISKPQSYQGRLAYGFLPNCEILQSE